MHVEARVARGGTCGAWRYTCGIWRYTVWRVEVHGVARGGLASIFTHCAIPMVPKKHLFKNRTKVDSVCFVLCFRDKRSLWFRPALNWSSSLSPHRRCWDGRCVP